jgi:hypothetical protein
MGLFLCTMLNQWHFDVGNLVQMEANGKIYEVIW